jgi:hypothetical protein
MIQDVVLLKYLKDRRGREYRKKDLLKQVVGKSLFGELGIGIGIAMNLERVSHVVTNIRIIDNDLVGDINFLKTPMGVITSTLVGEGVNFKTSIRAVGKVNKEFVVEDLIVYGFDLITENE